MHTYGLVNSGIAVELLPAYRGDERLPPSHPVQAYVYNDPRRGDRLLFVEANSIFTDPKWVPRAISRVRYVPSRLSSWTEEAGGPVAKGSAQAYGGPGSRCKQCLDGQGMLYLNCGVAHAERLLICISVNTESLLEHQW